MSSQENKAERAIAIFAHACERLNAFARELRERSLFSQVSTLADIREYSQGWRLEKYVEAQLMGSHDHVAAWGIEFGSAEGKWLVKSHVSISNTRSYEELDDISSTDGELEVAVHAAIDRLILKGQPECDFYRELQNVSANRHGE